MKDILLIATGGTIASRPTEGGLAPQLRAGDPVVIRMLGADGRSFSCASERCPAYLLRADGTIEPIE